MLFRSLVSKLFVTVLLIAVGFALPVLAQRHPAPKKVSTASQPASKPLQLLGIRPGISMDSIRTVLSEAGATMHEVQQDSLTHSVVEGGVRVFVVDSIICRLTYMRMSFLFDGGAMHLRRFTITPRESSIMVGQDDDVNTVLLLYFGEQWGKPEINFDPPACFKWRAGNIEVRGFIRRGYPMWVLEG